MKPSRATAHLLNSHSCTYTQSFPHMAVVRFNSAHCANNGIRLLHCCVTYSRQRQICSGRRGNGGEAALKNVACRIGYLSYIKEVSDTIILAASISLPTVHPPSFASMLTCFLNHLTVFGLRKMEGIKPRLDTDLIL